MLIMAIGFFFAKIFANSSGILESPDINKDGLYDQNLGWFLGACF